MSLKWDDQGRERDFPHTEQPSLYPAVDLFENGLQGAVTAGGHAVQSADHLDHVFPYPVIALTYILKFEDKIFTQVLSPDVSHRLQGGVICVKKCLKGT